MKGILFRLIPIIILFIFQATSTSAQTWMNGYSYRKKITIDKNKVSPLTSTVYQDLIDFPVLIEIEDSDLIHVPGSCGNKIQNAEGKDICFTLSSAPATPLDFQLEAYNATTGKITCWVRIPSLSARGTSSLPTSIYLYYGSELHHVPYNANNMSTWSTGYNRVWHMNQDIIPAESINAQSNLSAQSAIGDGEISASNYIPAKLNKGITLNGLSESLHSGVETSTAITISAWIKLRSIGTEQVIVTNNSITGSVTNGYRFKVNSSGQLVMELYKSQITPYSIKSQISLLPNIWYFVAGSSAGNNLMLFINGGLVQSKSSTGLKLGKGGPIKIGSSEETNQYFSGVIDELRIQSTMRSEGWLHTEYVNQNNPSEFYTIGTEEYDSMGFSKFIGTISNLWNVPSNWNNGIVPSSYANVVISAGKMAHINGTENPLLNILILEEGAELSISNNIEIGCVTRIATGASIKLNNGASIRFGSDVINDGSISLNQTAGTLIFSGNNPIQRFSGRGSTKVYRLENDQKAGDHVLILQAPIQVTGNVALNKGILNSNSNLTLCSEAEASATLLPIQNLNESGIIGNVHVQSYLSGSYPNPATARGWRLLSSPVYASNEGSKYYTINAIKKSMFITGPGGTMNGFDPSPLNGGTVYTHDQSLPGTLSQKYITIPNINSNIPIGKGIYVFSRGNREIPNAYINQIQTPPFSNPSGFTVNYTGLVYTGDLTVELYNKNINEQGDGFNLLGNPYPSPIKWGSLSKVNLSAYIWLFDPLNNAYTVSDAATTVIPSGGGFFVKVTNGNSGGSLKFTEASKYTGDITPALTLNISERVKSLRPTPVASKESRLTICLKRDVFEQQYKIFFVPNGVDSLNDNDALKIGEGFVSIAGLANDNKLSIDERLMLTEKKEIKLYINGWSTGPYNLNLSGMETFNDQTSITLIDKYLNQSKKIYSTENNYSFIINQDIPQTYGSNRFTLLFEPFQTKLSVNGSESTEMSLYPNPFENKFYLKTNLNRSIKAKLIISNLYGQIFSKQEIIIKESTIEINTAHLLKGIYLIKILDKVTNKSIKTFKVFKR